MKTNQIRKLKESGFAELWRDPVSGKLWTREAAWNVRAARLGSQCAEQLIDDSPEEVAATAYQIFGVMNAPVRVLDYFAALARGKRPENILPFSPDELRAAGVPSEGEK